MNFEHEFFEDEVRDGFFVPAEIKHAWAAELEVLSEVDRICKKYNINYYADWGTLLATVRHEGFMSFHILQELIYLFLIMCLVMKRQKVKEISWHYILLHLQII